jgi:large repetitive protein
MSISQNIPEIIPLNNELPLPLPIPIPESNTQGTVLPNILVSHDAELIRVGNDLMIQNPDESEIIKDYFVNPMPIKTVEGLILSVDDITASLNSPTEPVLLATNETNDLITTAPPAKIGIVSATAEGPITAQDKDGAIRVLHEGEPVYLHDLIVTPANGYVKITLLDDTLFQLGPNSRASLDKYAFDPSVDFTGEFESFVFSGTFRYISGKISGNNQGQHTLIKTPSANIGIRGSEIDAVIGEDGSTTVLHLSGLITVSSRYHAKEILVYERGTSIYIPNDNVSYTVNQLTEDYIQQRNQEWQNFRSPTSLENQTSETIGIDKPTSIESPTDYDSQSEPAQPSIPQTKEPRAPLNQTDSDSQPDSDSQMDSDAQPDKETPSSTQENGPRHPFSLNQIDPNSDESVDDTISEIRNEKEELVEKPARLSETINRASPIEKNSSIEEKKSQQNDKKSEPAYDDDVKPDPKNDKVNQPQSAQETEDIIARFQEPSSPELPPRVELLPQRPVIGPNNVSPIAIDDNSTADDNRFDMGQNNNIIINAQTLLENDTDPNGDPLTIIEVNNSVNGTAEINEDGDIIFTRGPDFQGGGEFEYQISDGQGGIDTARVIVTGEIIVVDENRAPIARDDNETSDDNRFDLGRNNNITINAQDLLENDIDPDSDPLTIIEVNNSVNGTAEIYEDGDILFTRGPDFDGSGEFEYQISDGQGGIDTAQVFVTGEIIVVDDNRAPIARDDNETADDNRFDMGRNNDITINAQDLLENDSDPDGDSLTITEIQNSLNGTAEMNEDGDIVFTRNPDFQGNGEFEYQISDGQGGFDTARVFVTGEVNGVNNQAPTATDDNETLDDNRFDMGQNNNIIINAQDLLENDTDPNSDPLTIIEVNNSLNGIAEINEDGDILFTRGPEFEGTGEFDYQISDGQGGIDTARVFVTGQVNIVGNRSPTARNDNETLDDERFDMGENNSIIINAQALLENDTELDGDPLTIIEVNNSLNGIVEIYEDGNIVFTRGPDFDGTGEFDYQISDGNGGFDTARAIVTGDNRTPIARDDNERLDDSRFNMGPNNNITINAKDLLENDSDPNGDPLTLIDITNNFNGTAEINENGDIVFTRGPDFQDQGGFDYQISDGKGGFDTARVTLIGDVAPDDVLIPIVAQHDGPFDMGNNETITLNPNQLLDNDDGESLTIINVFNNLNGQATIDTNEDIVFTRSPNFDGTGEFDYQIIDSQGKTATATVTVIGNRLPNPQDDGPFEMGENDEMTINIEDLLENDTDPDGDSLTITDIKNSVNGEVRLENNGDIVFTRNDAFNGQGEFEYEVSDSNGGIDTARVIVTGDNREPIAENDNETADDSRFDMGQNNEILINAQTLLENDSDPDGDPLTITDILNGTAEINEDGDILFTRGPDFDSSGEFEYQISDGQRGFDTATVTITGENRPPNPQDDGPFDIGNNESMTFVANQLLANDIEPDGDLLTITEVRNSINGTAEMNEDGDILFTRGPDFKGQGEFEYEVSDGNGGFSTARVTISSDNTPIAIQDEFSTFVDTPLIISAEQILANDSDPDGDPSDLSVVGLGGTTNGSQLTPSESENDNMVFIPAPGIQEDSFAYIIQDSDSKPSSPATIKITVSGNPLPDNFVINKNNPLTFQDTELWRNDENVQGQTVIKIQEQIVTPDSRITINAVDKADNNTIAGTVEYVNGQLTFTPTAHYTGEAVFEYTLQDALGRTKPVGVTIQVDNTPPKAEDDTAIVAPNSGQQIISVLENDTDDDPRDTLTIQPIQQQPAGGTVEIVNNQILFTPNPDFVGITNFDYTIADRSGATNSATVTVKVNTPPEALNDNATVTPNSLQNSISVLDNDIDNDSGDQETLILQSIVQPSADGTVEIVDNQILFTPNADFVGITSFDYTIADRTGDTDSATVTVKVNTPPEAVNDTATVTQNSLQNPISVLDNDIDNDPGDQETLIIQSIVQQPVGGTAEIVGDQILFTPNPDFVGETNFDYTIADRTDDTDSATVTVMVEAPLPPPLLEDPIITLNETPLDYNVQNQPLLIDSSASVFDEDSPNFDGGTLEVVITQNRSRYDVLEIQNQGPITVSSNNGGVISYNNTPIGNFTTHFATGALFISFNMAATPETATALLQAISYKNTTEDPLTRTVELTLTDGDGGTSNIASRQIEVTPLPPSPEAVDDQIEIPFNQPVSLSVSQLLDNDKPAKPDDTLRLAEELDKLSPGVEASVVGNEVQLFIDALANDNVDEATFDYTVIDDKEQQDTATVTLIAQNVQQGTPGDDVFTGTDGTDIFQGQEGNDTFQPSIGPDILSGGENDDLFLFDPSTANGVHISGDPGLDTLRLSGADNQRLDLLQNRNLPSNQQIDLQELETIDLSAGTNNELRLSLQDVLDITDNNDTLIIDGNESSRVISTGENWNPEGLDATGLYNRYTNGDAELLVSADISNQFIS